MFVIDNYSADVSEYRYYGFHFDQRRYSDLGDYSVQLGCLHNGNYYYDDYYDDYFVQKMIAMGVGPVVTRLPHATRVHSMPEYEV